MVRGIKAFTSEQAAKIIADYNREEPRPTLQQLSERYGLAPIIFSRLFQRAGVEVPSRGTRPGQRPATVLRRRNLADHYQGLPDPKPTLRQVADARGVSYMTLLRALDENNVSRPPRGKRPKK